MAPRTTKLVIHMGPPIQLATEDGQLIGDVMNVHVELTTRGSKTTLELHDCVISYAELPEEPSAEEMKKLRKKLKKMEKELGS